jgi:hypothetical protein
MDRLTEKKDEIRAIRESIRRLNNYNSIAKSEIIELYDDIIDKLKQYEDVGFTPDEIHLLVNPPEEIYIIEYDEDKKPSIVELDICEEMCVQLARKDTFWNCTDKFGEANEVSVSGLGEDYFLSYEEAKKRLEERCDRE